MVKVNPITIFKWNFLKWLISADTRKEIASNFVFLIRGIKRVAYNIWYGLFYTESRKFVNTEIIEVSLISDNLETPLA